MIKHNLKFWKTLFITLSLVLISFSYISVANNEKTEFVQLSYSFENPSIITVDIQGSLYDRVTLTNCYTAGNPGEPNIPSKGAYILLPPMTEPSNIQIDAKNKITLGIGFNIDPVEQPIPIADFKVSTKLFMNKEIYEKNDYYPGNLYSYVGVHSFRGYDILVLLLHPMQYNPITGELFYYKELDVTVQINPNDNLGLFRGLASDQAEIKNKVDNPEIAEYYNPFITIESKFVDSYNLLILTTDSLKTGFEPLKNAHDAKGLETVIKTLSDVGSSDPEDIRDYIRDSYYDLGVNYVLIGGDHDVVPARILWVFGLDEETTPYETFMPSDLYYSCLDGPYNYDGDEKWGEPTDGEGGDDVDLFGDVYVGRACVDDTNDVSYFVDKTVAYINKDPEDEYLTHACLAGEYMGEHGIATWGGNYMDQLEDTCSDDGYTTDCIPSADYTITKLYDRDWEGNDWPKQELMDIIDGGVHFINHLGHAYYEYNMKMYYEDVYGLSNTDYCFIYSQGCMAGGFDVDYVDCIAEHFTVKTDTGAFAGIWNARYGWFWSESTDGDSQRFHRQFWDAVFGEQIPQIGRANSDSKEDNLAIINRSCIRWCYYQLNLFGDPSLQFYEIDENDPPEKPQIGGPARHEPGVEYEYTFESTDPNGDGVYYYIDWDDGTVHEWVGPFSSGQEIIYTHVYEEKADFILRAKARDTRGAESDWAEFPIYWKAKNKAINTFFLQILEQFPILEKLLQNLL